MARRWWKGSLATAVTGALLIDRGGRLLANKPGDSNWASAAVKSIVQRLLEQSAEPPQSRSDLKK